MALRGITGNSEATRRHFADLLYHLVSVCASVSPRVIIIEDAQWLDAPSWSLVDRVSRIPRVLVLVCTRCAETPT